MRRQSLRPRQIDIHAKMRIIRSEADLVEEDDGAGSSQPSTTFEELVSNLDESQQPVVQKLRRKKNIPIPVITTVASYEQDISDDFVVPTSYVRFQNLLPIVPHQEDARVEVDLDLNDMNWLQNHPKYGQNGDPRYQVSFAQFEKMLDVLEKASALINPNVITLAEAEEVFAKQMGLVKTPLNKVTVDVYNYWCQKRQQLKRPILRKFWPQTPLNDTNPHLVFRPREKERYKLRKHRKNDMEGYRKLEQLRSDFDRVRSLLELVKRREKCKRLEIDYLDEMRRQFVHELVDRSGKIRKPRILSEDDRDKQRKKKKKKKRHRKEDDATSTPVHAPHASSSSSSSLAVDEPLLRKPKIPSFLEYDTSNNLQLAISNADEPVYPTYPLPPSHLMAHVFAQPPKYRCRGRIGRGGRLIIDRIPVSPEVYYSPTEILARTPLLSPKTKTSATVGLSNALPTSTVDLNHAAVLVQETAFRPPAPKTPKIADELTVSSSRLQEIYAMSDSEDERLEPLSASIEDHPTGKKGGKGLLGSASHLSIERKRPVKFAIDV